MSLQILKFVFSVMNSDSWGQKEKSWRKKQKDGRLIKQRNGTKKDSSISMFNETGNIFLIMMFKCIYVFTISWLLVGEIHQSLTVSCIVCVCVSQAWVGTVVVEESDCGGGSAQTCTSWALLALCCNSKTSWQPSSQIRSERGRGEGHWR